MMSVSSLSIKTLQFCFPCPQVEQITVLLEQIIIFYSFSKD